MSFRRAVEETPQILFVFQSVVLFALLATTMAEESAELQVVHGNGHFTNNWYKVLADEKPGENVFCSPVSAHAVLSMAWQGAKEETSEAFAKTLHVPNSLAAADGYKTIMERLNNAENITLSIANKIFLKDGHTLLDDFKNAVTQKFSSDVQLVDFAKNVEAAATINNWVEDKTNKKIKDLIKPDDLDELTRLVLVNAIYFKGNWAKQFNKDLTESEPFYLNDKDQVNVDMMHIKADFRYKQDDQLAAQVLELPYKNRDYSMVIVLPNSKNGINDLEQKLVNTDLTSLTKNMFSTEVNVALPKFKFETTIKMNEHLQKLGLGVIFDQEKANFKGMIPLGPGENLYVSKVIQKAFIEVNEEGAEAAAATGVHIRVTRSLIICEEFSADHPFIFLLTTKIHNNNNHILFYGKLLTISESKDQRHDEL